MDARLTSFTMIGKVRKDAEEKDWVEFQKKKKKKTIPIVDKWHRPLLTNKMIYDLSLSKNTEEI